MPTRTPLMRLSWIVAASTAFALAYGLLGVKPGPLMTFCISLGPQFAVAAWLAADARLTQVGAVFDAGWPCKGAPLGKRIMKHSLLAVAAGALAGNRALDVRFETDSPSRMKSPRPFPRPPRLRPEGLASWGALSCELRA